jgi:guanine deaminase
MKKQTDMNSFMKHAVDEAMKGVYANDGGPFGAVIVHGGSIITQAHNEVIGTHDPTAHAEMVAIRKASHLLGRFDLSDCEIYSSCEPCPMCYSAIFWARIKRLYFALSRKDAETIGFDDRILYEVLAGRAENTQCEIEKIDAPEFRRPFDEWLKKTDKIPY